MEPPRWSRRLLGDFPLGVSLGAERYTVICRDVPTAVFWFGFPNTLPMMPCFESSTNGEQRSYVERLHTWMLELIPRVAVSPVLTQEIIYRLDDAALDLVIGYLHGVGMFSDDDVKGQAANDGPHGLAARRYLETMGAMAEELLPAQPVESPRLYAKAHLPFVRDMAPNVRLAVREVAKRGHALPSVVWQLPISEFLLNFHLLITDEPRPGQPGLTPEDALIGFERY